MALKAYPFSAKLIRALLTGFRRDESDWGLFFCVTEQCQSPIVTLHKAFIPASSHIASSNLTPRLHTLAVGLSLTLGSPKKVEGAAAREHAAAARRRLAVTAGPTCARQMSL
ncbi:hypothetical protein EYF80_003553 [Liparis tanakae]|uniref:Uncharacterized protein n=1 Tax=Liparis tanakae TaxID=230148 RepID=A0A4Z2J7G4_9TELE|nr:hypothetical protein EYF80_003553 [Liparis tanakae]